MKKIVIFSLIAVVLASLVLGGIIAKNNKRAEIIYQNFLGKTFEGELEDDNGFYDDYRNHSFNEYMIYWLDKEERSLSFDYDGNINYTTCSERKALAYPKGISKPEGYNIEHDGTYNSFRVRVTLTGKIYLDIGSSSCLVTVNDENVPVAINDYDGMTLTINLRKSK